MKNPQDKKAYQFMRKGKKFGLIILSFVAFLIVLLAILIYTSLGLKLVTGILAKVMPEIQIERVDGTLNNFEIEKFALNLDGVKVSVGEAKISLSALCIIEGKICVNNFDAKDIIVDIQTDELPKGQPNDNEPIQEEPSNERFIVSMPLPLELKSTTLVNANVYVDDMNFGFETFQGGARWINEKIYVYPSVAQKLKAVFADSNNTDSKPTSTDTTHSISETIENIFNKPLIASLPQVSIPLDIYVSSLTGTDWLLHMGNDDYYFNDVTIKTNIEDNFIKVNLVKTKANNRYVKGDVEVKGQITLGEDWPVAAEIAAKTEKTNNLPASTISGVVAGKLVGVLATQTKIVGLNQTEIDAEIDFLTKYMPLKLCIKGQHIQWPVMGKADYQLNDFDVDLSGSVQKYHLNADGDFLGNELPAIKFSLRSEGTPRFIQFNPAIVNLPQGKVDLSGKIDWLNSLKWDASVLIKELNLSQELPEYPIKLDGKMQTSGEVTAKQWVVNLDNVGLNGDINNVPFQTNGSISLHSKQFITANLFKMNWGHNHIDLNGTTQQDHHLIATLNLADLSELMPTLQGKISGDLKIAGTLQQMNVDSELNATNFGYETMSLAHAQLTGKIKYTDLLQGDITLKANQFSMGSIAVDTANITLNGNELEHHLTVDINGKPISTSWHLNGFLNKDRSKWRGELTNTILALGKKSQWQANKPIKFNYDLSGNQIAVNAHCWIDSQSKICLDNDIKSLGNRGEASISLNDIDLKVFSPFYADDTSIAGRLQGKANIKWDPKFKIPTIVATIDSSDMYVKQQIASQSLPIPFDLFTVKANINDNQMKLFWRFSIKDLGKFNGDVQIDDPTNKKKLSGNIDIDKLSLSIVNPLLDNNEHAVGFINSQLKFSGTLPDPYITGYLNLKNSEIKSTQLPVDIRSMMIDLQFKGKSSVLNGIMQTKAGNVNINGKADWKNIDNWQASLKVDGAAIEISLPSLLTMSVVPDLHAQANQNELNLSGKITIPKAKITVDALPPSTVDVSPDEVILDKNLRQVKPQDFGMTINAGVLVSLGKHVSIDAFGLAAKLAGDIFITQTNKGTTLNGQITLPEGRFHAYGQDLTVRKGEIIFSGPADQPRLNIEAIRNPASIEDGVTAGIRVTGLADDPKIEIFSDPAMSQQEALSYLLRGQGLNSSEQSDNDMLTAFLIGMGTAQTGNLVGDIGNAFGIKNLTLDTQGVGNDQKVVVSGYLLPNLQLNYGVGIFDSLATFTLRYRLLPRLYLEAASGLDQTVDLIYQFEF